MIADGFFNFMLPSEIIEKRKITFQFKVSRCNNMLYYFNISLWLCQHYHECLLLFYLVKFSSIVFLFVFIATGVFSYWWIKIIIGVDYRNKQEPYFATVGSRGNRSR